MDYIREFDIRLDKEHYYAGEIINGLVVLDTVENFKLRCMFLEYYNEIQWLISRLDFRCSCYFERESTR